jgi:hypothetical protein
MSAGVGRNPGATSPEKLIGKRSRRAERPNSLPSLMVPMDMPMPVPAFISVSPDVCADDPQRLQRRNRSH